MVATSRVEAARALVEAALGQRSLPTPVSSLDSLFRFCLKLGLIAYGRKIHKGIVQFAEREPDAMLGVVEAGWRALDDWPNGFHRYLANLRKHAQRRRGRYGVVKEFGLLPIWFEHEEDSGDVERLRQEFVSFTAMQADLATRVVEVRRKRSTGPLAGKFITAAQGKDMLGVTFNRMHALAALNDLWLVPPDGSGKASLLDAEKFHAFANRAKRALTKAEAARLLAVPKKVFWKIEDAGLLPAIPETDRILPLSMYRRQDVEDLLARLEAKLEKTRSPTTRGPLVTVDHLARGGVGIDRILYAVLDNTLQPRAINAKATGVRRLLFDQVWIHELLGTRGKSMSVDEAAKIIGVKQEVAYEWVRRGLLRTFHGSEKHERGARITQEAIEAFRKEYVTGAELAASIGSRSRRYGSEQLMQIGLEPVSGPSVDGTRQFLFRRPEADRVKLNRLQSPMRAGRKG